MTSLSFGKIDETWSQYDLTTAQVRFNGDGSRYKAIIRKERELIMFANLGYQLFPNEEALKIANEAADLAEMQPFEMSRFTTLDSDHRNVIYNNRKTYMHAWYIPKAVKFTKGIPGHQWTVGKENVNVGVDIRNSIDGSSCFGCGLFTWRAMCSNGVMLGYRQISGLRHIHTRGLQKITENLKDKMILIMEQAGDIMARYREMAEQDVTKKLIEHLRESKIPKKVLPDYIPTEKKQEVLSVKDMTEWELYNDITQLIWHNEDADVTTQEFQFKALHKVMPLKVKA